MSIFQSTMDMSGNRPLDGKHNLTMDVRGNLPKRENPTDKKDVSDSKRVKFRRKQHLHKK